MLLAALAGGALARASASAQPPTPPRRAGPQTIVGVVTDTTGIPLDSVDLLISSVKRRAMSGPDGTFRFDDLRPGKYQIAARRLGFYPQVHDVTVGDKGGVVSFSLLPGIPALPPVVSSVARGGLSGVIGDTAYNIVEGAKIAVVASDHRTVSDSMGRFFLDLKPGKYMVNVSRPGYATRLVSVTIPNDSGRRMTVWLMPADQAQTARDAAVLDSLTLRLELRNPAFSTILTREDINRLHIEDGLQLARLGGNSWKGPLDDGCMVIIDGGPRKLPLWSIDAADIEMMETYTPRPSTGAVTSIRADAITPAAPPLLDGHCNDTKIYVWLRK
jgi:carboxypeptidase family protein